MTEKELEEVENLARRYSLSRNALIRFLVLYGLKQIHAGRLKLDKFITKSERGEIVDP